MSRKVLWALAFIVEGPVLAGEPELCGAYSCKIVCRAIQLSDLTEVS
jgi:hypothetical protein